MQKITGLYQRGRNKIWHIDKIYRGIQIRGSTGTSCYEEAVAELEKKKEEIRLAKVYGVRPRRSFRSAATYYLETKKKRSLKDDARHLRDLDPYIGNLYIDEVHDGTLRLFIDSKYHDRCKPRTINAALQVVRHILNLCATTWRDENSLTWLSQAPKITMEKLGNTPAKPYPLSWKEQDRLMGFMNRDLAEACLFKVNTGLREQEVCHLKWEWEYDVVGYDTSIFIIPGEIVKNEEDRLVIMNDIARSVIESRRGNHNGYVFPSPQTGGRRDRLNSSGWRLAWRKAGLPISKEWKRGVHNLKHTFGRRLRAAGVSFEDRQILLGHKNGSMTTHYSGPEILNLIEAANKVCHQRKEAVLRLVSSPAKLPQAGPKLVGVNG